jgi:hypothetical protein
MRGRRGNPQVFLIVENENSFGDAKFLRQAKAISSPLCVLLRKGIRVPSYFIDEVGEVLIEEWITEEDIYSANLRLIRKKIEWEKEHGKTL